MKINLITLVIAAGLSTACVNPPKQTTESVTFKEAMKQLAAGLNEFDNTSQNPKQVFGLVPSEVDATFNIAVTKEGSNESTISIDPTNIIKEVPSIGSSWTYDGSEKRDNNITIKFQNVLFSKKGEAIYDKEDIAAIFKALRDAEVRINNDDLQGSPN